MKRNKHIYSIDVYETCPKCNKLINPDDFNYEVEFCKKCVKEMRRQYKKAKH